MTFKDYLNSFSLYFLIYSLKALGWTSLICKLLSEIDVVLMRILSYFQYFIVLYEIKIWFHYFKLKFYKFNVIPEDTILGYLIKESVCVCVFFFFLVGTYFENVGLVWKRTLKALSLRHQNITFLYLTTLNQSCHSSKVFFYFEVL